MRQSKPQEVDRPRKRGNSTIVSIMFLVLVPITAHLFFSSLGFNPTDDGFTLAYSRRIIDGQIPHRDFITIRPFLSPVIHVPFVLWGGDYTYLSSRLFVWFQFACVAWIWVSLIDKRLGRQSLGHREKVLFALIAFAVSAHTFPIMAWHTLDGLFLLSIGLALCQTKHQAKTVIGYFVIGLAYLCKQSFLFAAPFALILLGDWRQPRYWLAILTPAILYVACLLITHALPDASLQLTSQNNMLSVGLRAYFNRKVLLGVLVGYLSAHLVIGSTHSKLPLSNSWKAWLGLLTLSVVPLIGVSTNLVSGALGHLSWSSFGLFGMVVGVVACLLARRLERPPGQISVALLVLMMAWSASISIGYNFPVLASGQLLVVLLCYARSVIPDKLKTHNGRRIYTVTLLTLSTAVLVSFGVARRHHIYRDQAAHNLTKRLDAVLPGGKGIVTNANTYEFLVDLREAIRVAQDLGTSYAIIPDCAGWWVKSPQVNPLAIDWPQGTELNDQRLVRRVTQELESMRDSNIVIVQKVKANLLADGFTPLGDRSVVVGNVRHSFTRLYETTFFELYR